MRTQGLELRTGTGALAAVSPAERLTLPHLSFPFADPQACSKGGENTAASTRHPEERGPTGVTLLARKNIRGSFPPSVLSTLRP